MLALITYSKGAPFYNAFAEINGLVRSLLNTGTSTTPALPLANHPFCLRAGSRDHVLRPFIVWIPDEIDGIASNARLAP